MKNCLDEKNLAQYYFTYSGKYIHINKYLGSTISIKFLGAINCISCKERTKKTFNNGYCYKCFRSKPECDICMFKPEMCHYSQGTCRNPSWGRSYCMDSHYIYLANTSHVKVGITHKKNIPSRWIDQGAIQALSIIKTTDRFVSGLLESDFKNRVSDRTNWRKMLFSEKLIDADLRFYRKDIISFFTTEINKHTQNISLLDDTAINISYPILQPPSFTKTLNLDTLTLIKGKLLGIKGQYLIFDIGVLNVRKFSGYRCHLSVH